MSRIAKRRTEEKNAQIPTALPSASPTSAPSGAPSPYPSPDCAADGQHLYSLVFLPSGSAWDDVNTTLTYNGSEVLAFERGTHPDRSWKCLSDDTSGFAYAFEFVMTSVATEDLSYEIDYGDTTIDATAGPQTGFSSTMTVYFKLVNGSIDSSPSTAPSVSPGPTALPTSVPTSAPTSVPSSCPTALPTSVPTSAPTSVPSSSPTASPTSAPTSMPSTFRPTSAPSSVPTSAPTSLPSSVPTSVPTTAPTSAPIRSHFSHPLSLCVQSLLCRRAQREKSAGRGLSLS